MVLRRHGQALDRGVQGRALRDRPGFHDAVPLQAKVVVERRGPVLLHDPRELAAAGFRRFPAGLRRDVESAFLPVALERRRLLLRRHGKRELLRFVQRLRRGHRPRRRKERIERDARASSRLRKALRRRPRALRHDGRTRGDRRQVVIDDGNAVVATPARQHGDDAADSEQKASDEKKGGAGARSARRLGLHGGDDGPVGYGHRRQPPLREKSFRPTAASGRRPSPRPRSPRSRRWPGSIPATPARWTRAAWPSPREACAAFGLVHVLARSSGSGGRGLLRRRRTHGFRRRSRCGRRRLDLGRGGRVLRHRSELRRRERLRIRDGRRRLGRVGRRLRGDGSRRDVDGFAGFLRPGASPQRGRRRRSGLCTWFACDDLLVTRL